jgi:hypothetical protein
LAVILDTRSRRAILSRLAFEVNRFGLRFGVVVRIGSDFAGGQHRFTIGWNNPSSRLVVEQPYAVKRCCAVKLSVVSVPLFHDIRVLAQEVRVLSFQR